MFTRGRIPASSTTLPWASIPRLERSGRVSSSRLLSLAIETQRCLRPPVLLPPASVSSLPVFLHLLFLSGLSPLLRPSIRQLPYKISSAATSCPLRRRLRPSGGACLPSPSTKAPDNFSS